MRALGPVLALLLLAACGGRVDDSEPVSSSSPGDGCGRACGRLRACVDPPPEGDCRGSCETGLDAEHALRFADCVGELSCEEIRRALTMDDGPVNACWREARRAP